MKCQVFTISRSLHKEIWVSFQPRNGSRAVVRDLACQVSGLLPNIYQLNILMAGIHLCLALVESGSSVSAGVSSQL